MELQAAQGGQTTQLEGQISGKYELQATETLFCWLVLL
jgi:hypothetical protein